MRHPHPAGRRTTPETLRCLHQRCEALAEQSEELSRRSVELRAYSRAVCERSRELRQLLRTPAAFAVNGGGGI